MQIVLNSKFFRTLSVGDLAAKVQALGFDGIDVNVRPGHPVNPANVATALPEAVALWKKQGLVCPLATAPVIPSPILRRILPTCFWSRPWLVSSAVKLPFPG